MANWRVYLNGSEKSLDFLAKGDSAEWSVHRDVERFYLTHSGWKELEAGTDAHAFAERFCDHINLAMSFLAANWEPVSVAAIQFVTDLGEVTHNRIYLDSIVQIDWAAESPTDSEELPPAGLLTLALAGNADLVDAIRIFKEHGDNWTQICNVIELAQHSRCRPISLAGVSKKTIDRLTHTANFRSTAGDTARHILGPGKKPPKRPMSLPEAQAVVRLIILRWLYSVVYKD
jgi:hypothetical protein